MIQTQIYSEIWGVVPNIRSGWYMPENKTTFKLKNKNSMENYPQHPILCPYCRKNNAVSPHHIIPRKYDGDEFSDNIIYLCFKCHDHIEVKTEDFIKSGMHYDRDLLKSMIINKGF